MLITNDCKFLLSPLTFHFIPICNASPPLLSAWLIQDVAKVKQFISMLISTHLHCRVMHIHRLSLYFSFSVLMAISFFTVEAIHRVDVPVYSWRAVFPLSCASFFFLCIDSHLSWLWVMRPLVLYFRFLIIWHSSYSVSLFFVSWYITIFCFGEITFLKKPQTITDYFLCTMKTTMSR